MKEKEMAQNQSELTSQPNSSNLKREENLFMPDGTNGGPERLSKNKQQESASAADTKPEQRKKLKTLINNPTTPVDVKRVVLNMLSGSPDAEDKDKSETSAEIEGIESAEDFYEAITSLIGAGEYKLVRSAIDRDGEGLVRFLTEDMPSNLSEKYLDKFKELSKTKGVKQKEFIEDFQNIIKNIGNERKAAGLEEPGVRQAREYHERNLSPQLRGEVFSVPSEPEEPENEAKALPEDEKTLQGVINEIGGYIRGLSKNPDFIHNLAHNADVEGLITDAYGFDESRARREEWDEIVRGLDSSSEAKIQQTQKRLSGFIGNAVNTINRKQKDYEGETLSHRITSVQELAKWIIKNQDSELWGEDGIYPLLDKDGNFNQANFMIWLREESVKHHKNNPNSEMTPLSSVGISTDFRDISVYAMSLLKEQYMRDKKEGRVLKDLAGQLIWEGFMFGELRNMHLFYMQGMGDDKKIAEVLQQVHGKNTLTRPGNLQMMMRMSEDYDEDKGKRDTRVGDAFRTAIDIYNNISDPETLTEILGGDYKITQEDFKDAFRTLKELKDWDEDIGDFGEFHFDKDDPRGFYYFNSTYNSNVYLFRQDGSIDMDEFSRVMNFYNIPSEESTKLDLIREIVRIKAAQKAGLKRSGMAFSKEAKQTKKEEFEEKIRELVNSGKTKEQAEKIATSRLLLERYAHRANLEYAEVMAFSWQRPYGSAAKQDLGKAGYDAMTKMETEKYLLKQSNINRGGAVGIPEQLGLFKDLSPDPMTGIRTESGRTINEIMRDLRKLDNDGEVLNKQGKPVTKDKLISELKFREYAESYYARNQQTRAVQIFHTLSDANELDLDKIVSWSYLEGVKYHVGEFQKQINEGIIKPFRYSIINSNVNYAEQVRIYEADESDEQKGSYRTGTLAEKTVGKELYAKLVRDFEGQTDDIGKPLKDKYSNFDKFLESYDARVRLAKNSSLGVFAAQLRSHRKLSSLGQAWTYHRTETFIDALKTIQAYEEDPSHPGRYKPAFDEKGRPKRYFSDKDIDWLRKNSGAEVWRMLMIDSAKEAAPAFAGGLLESFIKFFETLVKSEFKAA